jgi:hypothetical protein
MYKIRNNEFANTAFLIYVLFFIELLNCTRGKPLEPFGKREKIVCSRYLVL